MRYQSKTTVAMIALWLWSAGCVRQYGVIVTYPAALTLRGTVGVGEVFADDPLVAGQLHAQLEAVLRNGRNHALVVASPADTLIEAQVLEDASTDTVDVRFLPGRYLSSYRVQVGVARSRIRFRVVRATGELLDSVVFGDDQRRDNVPGSLLLQELRRRLLESFVPDIEPWTRHEEIDFAVCAWDSRCRRAFEAVRAGRLDVAEAWLAQLIDARGRTGSPSLARRRLAAGLYNRALVRALRGRLDEAVQDLREAVAIEPRRHEWRDALTRIANLARDSAILEDQGAIAQRP